MSKNLKRLLALLLALTLVIGITWYSKQSSLKASDDDGYDTAEELQEDAGKVSDVIQLTIPAITPEPDATAVPEQTEESVEPEATADPEVTEEPETTAEPEVTEEPETTAEPEVTEEPEATAEPEVTEEPEATAEPEVTEETEATAEPEVTEEPEATAEPEVTEEPEATAEPETTEETEATTEPETTPEPSEEIAADSDIVVSIEIIDEDSIALGEMVYFSIRLTGADISEVESVLWQYSVDGAEWTDIPDCSTPVYGFVLNTENLLWQYRAIANFR